MSEKSYLAFYDCGEGGIWFLLVAHSFAQAQSAYPELLVLEERPDWMSEATESEYRSSIEKMGWKWKIDESPTGLLADCIEEARQKK
jgi:hypothetical protein